MDFNLKSRNTIVSLAFLVVTLIVMFIPFVNTTTIKADREVEFTTWAGRTWADLPVKIAGEHKDNWPSEIKFGEFNDWEPEVQAKYPLYGDKNISIFWYVWMPAGSLHGAYVNCFVLIMIMFIGFGLISFLVKNKMTKAVFSYLFGAAYIYSFIRALLMKTAEVMDPFMVTTVLLLIVGLALVAYGVILNIEFNKERAAKLAGMQQ